MKGLIYYSGNKLEKLAYTAAEFIRNNPLSSPLKRETILIQTDGMERWLALEIAKHNNIFSCYEFITPHNLPDLARRLSGLEDEEKSPYSRNLFVWSLLGLLDSNLTANKNVTLLSEYIKEKDSIGDLKRFQIASLTADLFDQYALYRSEILEYWDSGKLVFADNSKPHELWQFAIWRLMNERYGGLNHHKRLRRILNKLDDVNIAPPAGFPERLICFGISMLPEYHLSLLEKMSAFIPVHLFHYNPSKYYWGDIVTDKERARIERRTKKNTNDSHLERGNALLADFGRSGRDFLTALYEGDILAEETDLFDDAINNDLTLLHSIQNDIAELNDRAGSEKQLVAEGDNSLCFVSCHSPMREVEVLHDSLLELFNHDKTLEPREILVLTTDINLYAPYIDTVFGIGKSVSGKSSSAYIPYSIADRSISGAKPVVRLYLDILELLAGRMEASKVMSVFDSESLRKKYSLEPEDMEVLNKWVTEANIRWGLDGAFREELSLPTDPENTWLYGLERMMLGYAMQSSDKFFDGLYPFDEIEGSNAQLLGDFASFIGSLAKYVRDIKRKKTIAEWKRFFTGIINDFFDEDGDDESDVRYIRGKIEILDSIISICDFTGEISYNVVKSYFTDIFNTDFTTRGFITGGVTVCSMVPLRSIPFRIIYVLGMNDSAFPRNQRPLAFDLMRENPKRGDRSTRDSDRYLFLETILSAREKLFISYVGRNIKDNSLTLPSNVVTELQDYISEFYSFPNGKSFHDILVNEHPLQGFSDKYFNGQLTSFRNDNFDVARILHEDKKAENKKQVVQSYAGTIKSSINADELIRFFKNPAKYFMKDCLSINLESKSSTLTDMESLNLDGLEKYKMKEDILTKIDSGFSLNTMYRSSGMLPPGTIGEYEFFTVEQNVKAFQKELQKVTGGEQVKKITYSCTVSGITLYAGFDVCAEKSISFRPATVKPKDHLGFWIKHLILKAAGFPGSSVYVGEDKSIELGNVENANRSLDKLLDLYKRGHKTAIAFFPDTSFAYIEGLLSEKGDENKGFEKANETWLDSFATKGERDNDPYIKYCFDMMGVEALTEFKEIASAVFEEYLRQDYNK